ncbi:MAG: Chemotaxis response regulator protein-glutamate methylesterase CheB [Polyangiaceae bacterium]|nr:Chemotaxis response regulator protein-glutamate methylesterase CheB [Polyangiaceae bacterium]
MKKIGVLVVDDSAFARKVLRQVLSRSSNIEVLGTAHDGLDALERIMELKPDVITLDLMMPNLDGLGVLHALKKLVGVDIPRVVLVSMSDTHGDLAISALREGAVDIVQKPTSLANDRLYELGDELTRKVEAAAAARLPSLPLAPAQRVPLPSAAAVALHPRHELVVIGASTGGPQAVSALLSALPADFPVPLAVVIHIPPGFSQSLAEHLDRDSQLTVVEASDGLLLRPGLGLVARAGMHLTFERTAGTFRARVGLAPEGHLHRPSLDVTLQSAAEATRGRVLGVVLTGMGSDGLEGARVAHKRGGTLLTQSEASSVVYGMPRVVWEDGIAIAEGSIEEMPALLLKHL